MSQDNQEQIPMSQDNQEQTMQPLFAACGHHGKPLRGLMSTSKSRSFQGSFGRMFPLSSSLRLIARAGVP